MTRCGTLISLIMWLVLRCFIYLWCISTTHFTRSSKCLWRTECAERPSLKWCSAHVLGRTDKLQRRHLLADAVCSEKMSLRDYSFLHFSCMPTPSKALECRGDIKTMFKSWEDSQCEGNSDICLAERLMRWNEAAVDGDLRSVWVDTAVWRRCQLSVTLMAVDVSYWRL